MHPTPLLSVHSWFPRRLAPSLHPPALEGQSMEQSRNPGQILPGGATGAEGEQGKPAVPARPAAAGQDCSIQVWEVLPSRAGGSAAATPTAAGQEGGEPAIRLTQYQDYIMESILLVEVSQISESF